MLPLLKKLERGYNPCLRPLHDTFKTHHRMEQQQAEAGVYQANQLHLLSLYAQQKELPRSFSKYSEDFYKKHIRLSLIQAFKYVDEDGVVKGLNKKNPFLFFIHYLALRSLEYLNQSDPALNQVTKKLHRSAATMGQKLSAYANPRTHPYRALNLLMLDLATQNIAGRFFKHPRWLQIVSQATDRALKRQDVEGFFPDHRGPDDRGPSSAYHMYTLTTIYLFLLENPESKIADRMVRAVDWHFKIFYPCLHCIPTFDERERYSNDKEIHVSPLFPFSPVGRRLIGELIQKQHTFPDYELARILFFKKEMERLNPGFLKTLEKSKDWPLRSSRSRYVSRNKKQAVIHQQPWTLSFQTYRTPKLAPNHLWHRELQEHLEVYHEKCGIIFGGGNSLAQPEFSNLVTTQSHLCDRVVIKQANDSKQTLLLENHGWTLSVTTSTQTRQTQLIVKVLRTGKGKSQAWFQLPLFLYQTKKKLLDENGKLITRFSESQASGILRNEVQVFHSDLSRFPILFLGSRFRDKPQLLSKNLHSLKIKFDQPCQYQWPITPINVRQKGRKPLAFSSSIFLMKFSLKPKLSLRISIETPKPI
jgi:hypothetical protein